MQTGKSADMTSFSAASLSLGIGAWMYILIYIYAVYVYLCVLIYMPRCICRVLSHCLLAHEGVLPIRNSGGDPDGVDFQRKYL